MLQNQTASILFFGVEDNLMTVSLKQEKLTKDIHELASVVDQSAPRIVQEKAQEIADIRASSKKGNTFSPLVSKFFSIFKKIYKIKKSK